MPRKSIIKRKTNETEIELELNLDGQGIYEINTPVPFLDHMLAQLSKHGLFDLKIKASGDTQIDFHHSVEDIGLCLGEAFNKALGEKKGIKRFGFAAVPLNEALAQVALDLSGRPYLVYKVNFTKKKTGDFDAELVEEFLQAFVNKSEVSLHVYLLNGDNLHHIIESIFKTLACALKEAATLDPRIKGIPSTKGNL